MCLKLLTSNPKNRSASVCLTNYSFSKTQILFIASHKHYWCPYFWAQLSVRGPLSILGFLSFICFFLDCNIASFSRARLFNWPDHAYAYVSECTDA